MAVKPTEPPVVEPIEEVVEAEAEALEPGFHVMFEGRSIGCYLTAADAEAFADGHPRANGLNVTVEEVAG